MVSLVKLLQEVLSAESAESFQALQPDAVLVSESPFDSSDARDSCLQTVAASNRRQLTAADRSEAKTSNRHVVVLSKKARSKFSNMISVGRTTSNDVEIDSSSVSKFHAYFFRRDNGDWFVQDANSSNGTFVEGHRIPAETPTKIADGWTIQFSADTCYRFFTPAGLFHYLKSIQGENH